MLRPLASLVFLSLMAAGAGCHARSSVPHAERHGTEPGARWSFLSLPGAPALDDAWSVRLQAAWDARLPDYVPHTRHLLADGSPKYVNRLFVESSPYLLQHAHNPVNWYAWGDEAFETAKRLGRPVLLSIGYSTCHWCHVMEQESFEDEEVARAINEDYVPIKVDREERPDLDGVYMTAVEALTGAGGWPMTVWLTPDRRPFAGGTYFPARDGDRGASIGLLSLLRERSTLFRRQPDRVVAAASDLATRVRQGLEPRGVAPAPADVSWQPSTNSLVAAAHEYESRFDHEQGGLLGAPKFPSSLPIRFLLRYHRRTEDAQTLRMAEVTLEKMAAGGIHDHVGGGFHRYSTDARWVVPHFEKMLYDNARLAVDYLEGYQATGRGDFAQVVRDILRYVERDMTSPDGAFYAATDADSESPDGHLEEGRFFTWTPGEVEAVLGRDRARVVEAYFGIAAGGNFDGRAVLSATRPRSDVAQESGITPAALDTVLGEAIDALYAARSKRPAPLRDEKVLASWNGLMMSAFARAALVFGDEVYVRDAVRSAEFVCTRMRDGDRLVHRIKGGRRGGAAYLDDYAFVIAGLLDLYETTSKLEWLRQAMALDGVLRDHFEDPARGGYFRIDAEAEALLAREKPDYDGAEPSGNSIQALNLLRLHELTGRDEYRVRAARSLRAFEERLARTPAAMSEMLLAVDFATDRAKEVVLVAPNSAAEAEPLRDRLRRAFVPNRVFIQVVAGLDAREHAALVPIAEGKEPRHGGATAYVCEGQSCLQPTNDPDLFAEQLRRAFPIPR